MPSTRRTINVDRPYTLKAKTVATQNLSMVPP